MQSQVQRLRHLSAFRPRQPRNDVNTGALPPNSDPALPEAPGEEASHEERERHFLKRCARRDLL